MCIIMVIDTVYAIIIMTCRFGDMSNLFLLPEDGRHAAAAALQQAATAGHQAQRVFQAEDAGHGGRGELPQALQKRV